MVRIFKLKIYIVVQNFRETSTRDSRIAKRTAYKAAQKQYIVLCSEEREFKRITSQFTWRLVNLLSGLQL